MTSRRQRTHAKKLLAQTKRALANSAIHLPLAVIEMAKHKALEVKAEPEVVPVKPIRTLPNEQLRSDAILIAHLQNLESRLEQSVDRLVEFGVTQKAADDLKAQGIYTISDLKGKSNKELLELPKFGSARVARIRDAQKKFESQ
jgi:hypothetical protein